MSRLGKHRSGKRKGGPHPLWKGGEKHVTDGKVRVSKVSKCWRKRKERRENEEKGKEEAVEKIRYVSCLFVSETLGFPLTQAHIQISLSEKGKFFGKTQKICYRKQTTVGTDMNSSKLTGSKENLLPLVF